MSYRLQLKPGETCAVPVAHSGPDELAHVAPIAQALKTCADELSLIAQALKTCAHELPPIAQAGRTRAAHVAHIAHQ